MSIITLLTSIVIILASIEQVNTSLVSQLPDFAIDDGVLFGTYRIQLSNDHINYSLPFQLIIYKHPVDRV